MKKRIVFSFSLILFAVLLLTACGTNENEQESNNGDNDAGTASIDALKIHTTLFTLEDFTKKIGGELVDVTNIVPAGADAHSFEPTIQLMIDIAEGDLFIYNSASFEGFAQSIIQSVKSEGVEILEAAHGIDFYDYHSHDQDDDHGHSHGSEDPHVWLDPIRAIQLAENIKDTLVNMLPEEEETFKQNFEKLKGDLEELDQEFQTMRAEATKDTIIVSHAGYGYWEDRYDIHQVAITGLSPTNEPSVKQMQETIKFVKNNDIQYLMFEKNIPSKYVDTIKDETNTESLWLHNLETLHPDDIKAGEDYFSLMRKNIEILQTALE